MQSKRDTKLVLSVLALLVAVASLTIVFGVYLNVEDADIRNHIIVQITLPVILTAFLVGAALSASAACLQVLLNNPLADPGIIGISSGASLVAAILLLSGIITDSTHFHYWLPLACFVGALLSTLLIYAIAKRLRGSPVAVILAGIAISTLAGALIAWLYYFADAQSLRNLTFWLMGSVYQTDWVLLSVGAPIILCALVALVVNAGKLNQLYLGKEVAITSGLDAQKVQSRLLFCCAIAVGAAVSLAGSVAFIGLLIPHLLRLLLGFNNRLIIPASALLGGLVLLCIVLITENWAVTTLPLSMLTATLGGPVFIWALMRGQFTLGNGR